jgi:hypothetical protein
MTRIPSLQKPGIESNPQDIIYQQQLPLLYDGLCLGKHSLNKPLRRYFLPQIIWESALESLDTCEEEFSTEVGMEINNAINWALDGLIKPPTKFLFSPLNKMRDYYVS